MKRIFIGIKFPKQTYKNKESHILSVKFSYKIENFKFYRLFFTYKFLVLKNL